MIYIFVAPATQLLHQQRKKVSFAPQPSQNLLLADLIIAIHSVIEQNFSVVLICTYGITSLHFG